MRGKLIAAIMVAATAVFVPAAEAHPNNLTWAPCAGIPQEECAGVEVPVDYQKPAGPRISIAVSRIQTAKPGLRRGVLLLIPGGPGNSGLDRPSVLGARLPQEVRDRYDIIGFDPRGTGRSAPVSCDISGPDADPLGLLPWPGADGDITGNIAKAQRVAQACAHNGGDLMRHISTRVETQDIDRIRQALGERKISYWAVSYGTYVGAVYATLFPNRTDRVILDSSNDPTTAERGWIQNFATGATDRFPDFATWAALRNDTYGLGTTPDAVTTRYLTTADDLDHTPRPDLTGAALRAIMLNSLYSDATFPLLAQTLQGGPVPPLPAPPPATYQNILATAVATACNDVPWPHTVYQYPQAVAENRQAFPLTAGMPANIWPCTFWPYPSETPITISSHGPENILMVQNRRDPATPYPAALKMRAALGHRARMISVNSGGHGSYLTNGNPCGNTAVTTYLTNGTPFQDTTC
ncbi:alpha/beta hydrolase [Actinokineospora inagensis]|uniref:alpha/beta hydrolase n=1 Tax=Actinokineospora inagensis TaxID=103730 RepID=UPI00040547AF|nr:alpha/beta hydrolase [Actinokineospora inagensis]